MPGEKPILPKTAENVPPPTTTTTGNASRIAPKPELKWDSTINQGAVSVFRVLTPIENTTEAAQPPHTFLETTVTQQNKTPSGESKSQKIFRELQ